jgi:hypothetical protein
MLTLRTSPLALSDGMGQPLALREAGHSCACGASLPLPVRFGLRSRSRPVLEGRWTCSARCLERQIAAVLRRESLTEPSRRPYRHRIPLGLVLLSTGAVTHDELRRALALQHGTGERIGDVLQREFGLSERSVAGALAVQWSCGVSTVAGLDAERSACLAPHRIRACTRMLPVRIARDGRIHVAFEDCLDMHAVFALQRMHATTVTAGIAPITEWNEAYAHVARVDGVALEEAECDDTAALERELLRTMQRLQPVESRFVRVHDVYWLRLWLESAALAGGPTHREDIVDVLYRVGQASLRQMAPQA